MKHSDVVHVFVHTMYVFWGEAVAIIQEKTDFFFISYKVYSVLKVQF